MPIDTTYLDSDTDQINLARPAILATAKAINDLESAEAGKGSALIGHPTTGETVKAALDARLPEIGTYALLRAYTGPLTAFYVRGRENIFDGAFGFWRVDTSDTTSADNGGTILVDAAGRRWKREFSGAFLLAWFGANQNAADNTSAIQNTVNAIPSSGGVIEFDGMLDVSGEILIDGKSNVVMRGYGLPGSWTSSTLGAGIRATDPTKDVFKFSNFAYCCTVEGLNIFGGKRALHFDRCLGFQVLRCNLRENEIGIEAFGNGVGVIRDNIIRNNSVAGIYLAASGGDTVITANDIGANKTNVLIATGNVKLHHNHIFSSQFAGAGVGVLIDATAASADATIRHVEVTGNLIAANDIQVKVLGTSLATRDVQDVHIHHNHIHQADDGGETHSAAFAYGQGILIQNAKRIHVSHNNLIGLRDYAVKAINVLDGVFLDHNHIRAGNAAGVIFDLVQWGRIDNNEFVSNVGTAVQMTCSDVGNFTQNNRVGGNAFQSNGAVYSEDARTRANFVYDNLGGTLAAYSLSATAPLTQVRHIAQAGNQESVKNQHVYVDGAAWNGSRLILGSHSLWVDATGDLRIKSGAPSSDTDGTVVGAQT